MSRSGQSRSRSNRSYLPIVGLVAIVVVALGIALLVSTGDGDGDTASVAADGDGAGPGSTAGVSVRGATLPPMPRGGGEDPGIGLEAPTLEGVAPDGTPTTVQPGETTLLAFLAHWCPHCQAELPLLVELEEEGALDDMRRVVVLTGTDERAPNYPPAAWLDREGWSGEVLVDDQASSAGTAFGLSSYPYLVLLDAEGQVVSRSAGALGADGLRAFLDQAP